MKVCLEDIVHFKLWTPVSKLWTPVSKLWTPVSKLWTPVCKFGTHSLQYTQTHL